MRFYELVTAAFQPRSRSVTLLTKKVVGKPAHKINTDLLPYFTSPVGCMKEWYMYYSS